MLLICYLALRAWNRGVEVSRSGELREYPEWRTGTHRIRVSAGKEWPKPRRQKAS